MGGITFLDYVKELPKGKRETKGATRGGYAADPKKAAAPAPAPAAAAATANADGATTSSARGLPVVAEAETSATDVVAAKIVAKVGERVLGVSP